MVAGTFFGRKRSGGVTKYAVMPQKIYNRKDMNAEDAVKLIYDNYIIKETQLDPILFELFVDFLIDIKKENIKNPFRK